MRVGFIQLPVPDHNALYARANRPLAAGYLIAFARRYCRVRDWEAEILPDYLADYGGDAAILNWILCGSFDAIFFTCYLWNRDRSLFLARAVKERLQETITVAGGPEVTDDQSVIDFPGMDILCIGEGEEFFARFLEDSTVRKYEGFYRNKEIANLKQVPNPYLDGTVPVRPGDIIHFEQMRGCAQRCAYCYYGKGSRGVRLSSSSHVPGIFELATRSDASEIYFMDPTFNHREKLEDYLRWIAGNNHAAIPIHAEVRLERIDRSIADAMVAAGIRSVEAGLQSTNPKALAAVGRTIDLDAFVRGARLLRERDIEIRTGVIIGLPEDGLEEFLSTIDFLEETQLLATTEGYMLAVLPGTVLRRKSVADRWKLQAMPQPPYWIQSTHRMTTEDFRAAIEILERRQGIDYFPVVIPQAPEVPTPLQSVLDWRGMNLSLKPEQVLDVAHLANSVTIVVDERVVSHHNLEVWVDCLMNATPHTCWRIVYCGNEKCLPENQRRLIKSFLLPSHYLNQSSYPHRDPPEAGSVRFFHVSNDTALRS